MKVKQKGEIKAKLKTGLENKNQKKARTKPDQSPMTALGKKIKNCMLISR